MTGCIYHEADLDGVMSAAIVKKYFKGDIDLLPYNYGKEIPDVNKYDKVFAVDVSFGNRTRFLFDEWKMTGSIYLIIEGNKKDDSAEFYGGLIATILSIFLMCLVIQNIKNTENMGEIYKFKRLNEMKLDDYGFGLFEYNGVLYFKEAEGERCFDVRSGNEVIIGKDKIVTALED